ncbi:hypothetical protein MPER_07647 [Moniliophthora perniciosa FA553]|nr:hypothetical protein MPER_07647 [Moniliophthora perniciosa FA553]
MNREQFFSFFSVQAPFPSAMKFIAAVALLATSASAVQLQYDPVYEDADPATSVQ